jgi:hypothetical protein
MCGQLLKQGNGLREQKNLALNVTKCLNYGAQCVENVWHRNVPKSELFLTLILLNVGNMVSS